MRRDVLLCSLLALLSRTIVVDAYIPATPSNDTSILPDPDNADSTILLRWTDQGNYQEGITRQLRKDDHDDETPSTGIEKGALVHFYENSSHPIWDDFTSTPWVALVNCDRNSSIDSQEDDIFTLARDRGAVAALLYSTWSEACILEQEYLNPPFDRVLDIYTTITKSSARLIESQFTNINKTEYYFFNAKRLNESLSSVQSAIAGNGVQDGYLIATVKLANVTDPDPGTNTNGTAGSNQPDNNGGGSSTGLAMIILYAITGCVSALFCVVIITGAVRALRHPERYGPRMGDPAMDGYEGEPQTRAAGLTRAILDTFPVVKFGRGTTGQPGTPLAPPPPVYGKYTESYAGSIHDKATRRKRSGTEDTGAEDLEMAESPRGGADSANRRASTDGEGVVLSAAATTALAYQRRASSSTDPANAPHSPVLAQRVASPRQDPTPDMIGTEICPICITDFEEGDDLRVLPCEGKHKFHRDCVDPWLLQISSLCPLCREDFIALENMATGIAPSHPAEPQPEAQASPSNAAGGSRFSRYLRTAQRQRHQQHAVPTLHENTSSIYDTPS